MSALDPLHPLEQFKQAASNYLPGLLAFFDLADTKRRNSHLGYMTIDEDIAEFDRLLSLSLGSTGMARRVGGDLWLAIYPVGSLPGHPNVSVPAYAEGSEPALGQGLNQGFSQSLGRVLSQVLDDYHQERAISIGWRCKGYLDGVVEVAEETIDTTITRSARCAYFSATSSQEMNKAIDELLQKRHTFPPGRPIPVAEIGSHEQISWRCVSAYPDQDPFCPFCKSRDFEWEDGDSNVYSGEGTCKNCKADIDIRGVELNAR